jgi:hypothetical protein
MAEPVHPSPNPDSLSTRVKVRGVQTALAVGAAVAAGLGIAFLTGGGGGAAPNTIDLPPRPRPLLRGFNEWAINLPPVSPASTAGVADDEEVIGVSAGGRHRAYLVQVLSGDPRLHVVNDRLADTPVSVTYCDRTHCTHVFTGPDGEGPLPLAASIWRDKQLLVRARGGDYLQTTLQPLDPRLAPFPHPELPFVRTTWKQWRAAHPNSDIYLGADPLGEAQRPGAGGSASTRRQ